MRIYKMFSNTYTHRHEHDETARGREDVTARLLKKDNSYEKSLAKVAHIILTNSGTLFN